MHPAHLDCSLESWPGSRRQRTIDKSMPPKDLAVQESLRSLHWWDRAGCTLRIRPAQTSCRSNRDPRRCQCAVPFLGGRRGGLSLEGCRREVPRTDLDQVVWRVYDIDRRIGWENCPAHASVLSHPLCKGRTMDGARWILLALELKML